MFLTLLLIVSQLTAMADGLPSDEEVRTRVRRMELVQISKNLVDLEREKKYQQGFELAMKAVETLRRELKINQVVSDSSSTIDEVFQPGMEPEQMERYLEMRIEATLKAFDTHKEVTQYAQKNWMVILLYKFATIKALQFAFWQTCESPSKPALTAAQVESLAANSKVLTFEGREAVKIKITWTPKRPLDVTTRTNSPMDEILVNLTTASDEMPAVEYLPPQSIEKAVERISSVNLETSEYSVQLARLDGVMEKWGTLLSRTLLFSKLDGYRKYEFGNSYFSSPKDARP